MGKQRDKLDRCEHILPHVDLAFLELSGAISIFCVYRNFYEPLLALPDGDGRHCGGRLIFSHLICVVIVESWCTLPQLESCGRI